MHDTILAIFLLLTVTANAQAKFNTIRANGHFGREIAVSFMQTTNNKESKEEKETLKADYTSESDPTPPPTHPHILPETHYIIGVNPIGMNQTPRQICRS